MSNWIDVIEKQVIYRNAIEFQQTECVFDAHRITQGQLLRVQQRLQELADENARLDEKCKDMAHNVRTLELAAAGVANRTSREEELETKVSELQKQLQKNITQEKEYYKTLYEAKKLGEENAKLREEVTQLKKDAQQNETTLQMIKIDHAAIKQENDVVRPKLGALMLERDRCLEELLAAKETILKMQEKILDYESELNTMRKERSSRREGVIAATAVEQPAQGNRLKASVAGRRDTQSALGSLLPTDMAYVIKCAHNDRPVYSACVADSGQKLISGGADRTIRQWELSSGKPLRVHSITDVPLSTDSASHYLLAGCADGIARFWDLHSLRTVELTGHSEKVVAAYLSHSAHNAFTASSDRTIKLWDLRSGAATRTVMCQSCCNDLCVSSSMIVSAHYNGSIWVWDNRANGSGTEIKKVHQQGVTCVRFDSDARRCVSLGRDGTVSVRDVREMSRELLSITNSDMHSSTNLARLALSPDGTFCAVGNVRGEVVFCSLQTGNLVERRLVGGHRMAVHSVVWTLNDSTPFLASIGEDRHVVVWK